MNTYISNPYRWKKLISLGMMGCLIGSLGSGCSNDMPSAVQGGGNSNRPMQATTPHSSSSLLLSGDYMIYGLPFCKNPTTGDKTEIENKNKLFVQNQLTATRALLKALGIPQNGLNRHTPTLFHFDSAQSHFRVLTGYDFTKKKEDQGPYSSDYALASTHNEILPVTSGSRSIPLSREVVSDQPSEALIQLDLGQSSKICGDNHHLFVSISHPKTALKKLREAKFQYLIESDPDYTPIGKFLELTENYAKKVRNDAADISAQLHSFFDQTSIKNDHSKLTDLSPAEVQAIYDRILEKTSMAWNEYNQILAYLEKKSKTQVKQLLKGLFPMRTAYISITDQNLAKKALESLLNELEDLKKLTCKQILDNLSFHLDGKDLPFTSNALYRTEVNNFKGAHSMVYYKFENKIDPLLSLKQGLETNISTAKTKRLASPVTPPKPSNHSEAEHWLIDLIDYAIEQYSSP